LLPDVLTFIVMWALVLSIAGALVIVALMEVLIWFTDRNVMRTLKETLRRLV
jgi:hypothetical protein